MQKSIFNIREPYKALPNQMYSLIRNIISSINMSFLRAFCEMKKIEENRHYPNFGYTKNIADILSSRMSNMESKEGGFGLDKKTFISREDKFFWREFKNMKSHYGII